MVWFFPGEHHGINEIVESWKIMSPVCSNALVWVVDPSAKPGGVEQVRENTVRRSKELIGAAERLIFQKKNPNTYGACFLCAGIPAADLMLFTFHPNLYNVDLDV